MKHGIILIGMLLLLPLSKLKAQNLLTDRVNVQLKGPVLNELVKQLEFQTSYRFYYDEALFKNFPLNLDLKNVAVREVLDKALNGSDFHYAVFENAIFLTKHVQILTAIPSKQTAETKINKTLKTVPLAADLSSGNTPMSVKKENKLANTPLVLREVVITSHQASNVLGTNMGVERLDIKTIKQVPTVFGEADVLRVVLTLPGVKSVGESSTGFNVRGGSVDQNLILFDQATVYNPSHFFGFFSAFNPEVISNVQLYKSSIPAKYGGRLSSVLELNGRDGNKKEFTGTAGIGLLTSRLNIEGPIIKDKTSFILGGRTTYSNWITSMLPENSGYRGAKASFYDLNLSISHQQNDKNSFNVTAYLSSDKSNLATDTTFQYQNRNLSLRWKHIFNEKLYGTISAGRDEYSYDNFSTYKDDIDYSLKFSIAQTNFKTNFNYSPGNRWSANFGTSSIYYTNNPGELSPLTNKSLVMADVLSPEQGLENALFVEQTYDFSKVITLVAGLRYSFYSSLGAGAANIYADGLDKSDANIVSVVNYAKGKVIKTYQGPEYRLGATFLLNPDLSLKAGYNTQRQYIHMLSNATSMSPTDIWKLSDLNIAPQSGSQFSLGVYKNFNSNTIETSVEGYYKKINDFLDYKSGAKLILNHQIEQDVLPTQGKAYGVEFLVKKPAGKLNGWVSYTYSRTMLKTDDVRGSNSINLGEYYPANYDKPHDFTFIGNYRLSRRVSVSLNVTYSTGRPITLPVGKYYYQGGQRLLYSERNQYRIPNYFRSDLSINILGNHRIKQLTHNSWTIGVYNLTNRKNAFATFFASENKLINGYQLSIFGTAIPFVNYNIRFK
ncbi:TonB dependent receptor [compost metagenome]